MKIKFKNEKIYKEGDSENYTRNITYYTKDGMFLVELCTDKPIKEVFDDKGNLIFILAAPIIVIRIYYNDDNSIDKTTCIKSEEKGYDVRIFTQNIKYDIYGKMNEMYFIDNLYSMGRLIKEKESIINIKYKDNHIILDTQGRKKEYTEDWKILHDYQFSNNEDKCTSYSYDDKGRLLKTVFVEKSIDKFTNTIIPINYNDDYKKGESDDYSYEFDDNGNMIKKINKKDGAIHIYEYGYYR